MRMLDTHKTLALVAAVLLSAPPLPLAAADRSADEAAIHELKEELWPKAYFEQGTELLDRFLAPEFQMIDGDGGWTTKSDESGPYVAEYQSTNVLIKRDGVWRAVASHVSGFKKIS